MTTPSDQVRPIRDAVERQRIQREAARDVAREIARERDGGSESTEDMVEDR